MAGHVVERRTTIAVLSMVKIDGNVMTATDLDTELSVTVPVNSAEGAICVPHALLLALVKNLPPPTGRTPDESSTGSIAPTISPVTRRNSTRSFSRPPKLERKPHAEDLESHRSRSRRRCNRHHRSTVHAGRDALVRLPRALCHH
ncbi:hypothetical protein, partial [Mycoplana rhizolycopersici]